MNDICVEAFVVEESFNVKDTIKKLFSNALDALKKIFSKIINFIKDFLGRSEKESDTVELSSENNDSEEGSSKKTTTTKKRTIQFKDIVTAITTKGVNQADRYVISNFPPIVLNDFEIIERVVQMFKTMAEEFKKDNVFEISDSDKDRLIINPVNRLLQDCGSSVRIDYDFEISELNNAMRLALNVSDNVENSRSFNSTYAVCDVDIRGVIDKDGIFSPEYLEAKKLKSTGKFVLNKIANAQDAIERWMIGTQKQIADQVAAGATEINVRTKSRDATYRVANMQSKKIDMAKQGASQQDLDAFQYEIEFVKKAISSYTAIVIPMCDCVRAAVTEMTRRRKIIIDWGKDNADRISFTEKQMIDNLKMYINTGTTVHESFMNDLDMIGGI